MLKRRLPMKLLAIRMSESPSRDATACVQAPLQARMQVQMHAASGPFVHQLGYLLLPPQALHRSSTTCSRRSPA